MAAAFTARERKFDLLSGKYSGNIYLDVEMLVPFFIPHWAIIQGVFFTGTPLKSSKYKQVNLG